MSSEEQSLIAGERLARLLLAAGQEGIYGIDLEGRCLFANPACARLLGLPSADDLLSRRMHEVVHPTRADGTPYPLDECHIHQPRRQPHPGTAFTEPMFRADGTSFPVECRVQPIEGDDGQVTGSVVSFRDISNEREMESRLAQQAAAGVEIARFPEMNPGPVLRTDLDGIVLMANSAALSLLGSDLVGSPWRELCTSLDGALWKRILDASGPVPVEDCVGDHEYIFHHRRAPEGDFVFVFGSDVTELRTAQRALSEVARFPEMNPGPVLRTDLEGRILLANTAARELLGDDLVGQSWFDLGGGNVRRCWEQILAATGPVPVEGALRDHDYVFTHRRAPDGDLVFVFGSDVSELRETQRALSEVARFPEMNPGPVLRTDLQGTVLLANAAARSLIGEDVVGSSWLEIGPDNVGECWDEVVKADAPLPLEGVIAERHYVFSHRRDAGSELVFIFGADVTEHRRVEEELRQSEKLAALGKLSAGLAHELNNPAAAAERASEQLLEALDRLQSAAIGLARSGIEADAWLAVAARRAAAHDREGETALTPLETSDREDDLADWLEERGVEEAWSIAPVFVAAGIRTEDLEETTGGLAREQARAAIAWLCHAITVRELTNAVLKSTRGISSLVNVVKSYSYMDRAPEQEIDIHAGIEDTLTILGHKLRDRFEVVRDFGTDLPRLHAKGSELNQVWTNLIDNAIDAMGDSGTLTIRTRGDNGSVLVEIADDGPGIPAEIQSRIFDPFFTTKDVGQGTGLGLDVVRRIVEDRCRGELALTSRPGETVFRVRLPVGRLETTPSDPDGSPGTEA